MFANKDSHPSSTLSLYFDDLSSNRCMNHVFCIFFAILFVTALFVEWNGATKLYIPALFSNIMTCLIAPITSSIWTNGKLCFPDPKIAPSPKLIIVIIFFIIPPFLPNTMPSQKIITRVFLFLIFSASFSHASQNYTIIMSSSRTVSFFKFFRKLRFPE